MIWRAMDSTRYALPALCALTMMSSGFCLDATAQSRAALKQPAEQTMNMAVRRSSKAEVNRLCEAGSTAASKRGSKTRYTCKSSPAGSSNSIQAVPVTQRADINCDYSEAGGAMSWLGCTCTANDEGNCNNFISNCVEGGDDVGGNSGSASCKPTDG